MVILDGEWLQLAVIGSWLIVGVTGLYFVGKIIQRRRAKPRDKKVNE